MEDFKTQIKNEWGNYIGSSAFKSQYTISTYKINHKRITGYLNNTIHGSSQEDVINAISNIANNDTTKGLLLNCGIVFYDMYDMDNELLIKEKKRVDDIKKVRDNNIIENTQDLPSLNDLEQRLNYLFYNERWRDVLILYLLLHFNCRNADLNVEIVRSIHATKRDKKRNYIVIRKEDFVFIRNNYKTIRQFGSKRHHFKSLLFSRALKYYIAQQPPNLPVYLILNENGECVSDLEINDFIKIATNGLTETDINKIQISVIEDSGDYKGLQDMADKRGVEINSLIFSHNLHFQSSDIIS